MEYLKNKGTGSIVSASKFHEGEMPSDLWEVPTEEEKILVAKEYTTKLIDQECERRIITKYSRDDQANARSSVAFIQNKEIIGLKTNTPYTLTAEEISTIAAASAGVDYIAAVRAAKSSIVDSLSTKTLEEINSLDYTDNSLWPSMT